MNVRPDSKSYQQIAVAPCLSLFSGAAFAPFIENIIMPNVVKTDIDLKDTSDKNKHPEIPVKTTYNDALKNTAEEPGLNEARTINNELEPGIEE